MFQTVKSKLVPIFGDNLVGIEHIGSTAVPGMLAKPQIDVLVIVKSIDAVKAAYTQMISLGFIPRGDYIEQQEESFILNDDRGERLYNIHTMQQDNPHAAMYVIFRDYLRSHKTARQQYIAKKQELNKLYGSSDYNAYDFGKEEPLRRLKAKAQSWHDAATRKRYRNK